MRLPVAGDTSGPRRAAPPVAIVTDTSWKASADAPDGWIRPEFDDDKWRAARIDAGPSTHGEHYGVENLFGFFTHAAWIWHGTGATVHFRRAFEAPGSSCRAELLLAADDEAEVWINGELVLKHSTAGGSWGLKGGAELLELAPFLRSGRNVVAVRARNGGGPCGFAAELRINGEPLLYPRRDPKRAVPDWAGEQLAEIAATRGVPARASSLLERYGVALVPVLRRLDPKPNVRAWLDRLAPDLGAAGDDRLQWREISPAAVKAVIGESGRTVALRWLVSMRATDATDALRESLGSADESTRTRAARTAAALVIPALAPDLASLLRRHPRSDAAAFAAVALGRIGSHAEELRAAAGCGYAPTERAAQHALGLMR